MPSSDNLSINDYIQEAVLEVTLISCSDNLSINDYIQVP